MLPPYFTQFIQKTDTSQYPQLTRDPLEQLLDKVTVV